MTKDFAAHRDNNKKSSTARLVRFTANALNSTLDTGAVGMLFTDTDDNSKPYKKDKLNYSSSSLSRSTHMIEGRDNQGASLDRQGNAWSMT